MPRWTAPGLALLACGWLLLIVAAPVLWPPLAAVLYVAGSLICHQLPERSFHIQTSQLPVCARCFGLYGGGALGSVAGAAALSRTSLATWLQSRSSIWIATAVAAVPTVITVALEWGVGWPVSNSVRAVAAVPLGFAVAFVVVSAVATINYG
jgi:uncharacterized membrane protein